MFLSGQTPIDPSTGALHTGDVGAQTHQCFDNLFAVLAAAGLTPADVVQARVYLTDMNDFAAVNAAYATRFDEPFRRAPRLALPVCRLAQRWKSTSSRCGRKSGDSLRTTGGRRSATPVVPSRQLRP